MKWSNIFFFFYFSNCSGQCDIMGDKAAQGKGLEVDYL